jgi:DNA integrity scanning protein DisA with diadenylate cyclase activity
MDDAGRTRPDRELDAAIPGAFVDGVPRRVLVELASLDGALVIGNSGRIVACLAILGPRRQGNVGRSEGSRTKAAIGASLYGLAVKMSSDGDISASRMAIE